MGIIRRFGCAALLVLGFTAGAILGPAGLEGEDMKAPALKKSAAELEKEKALANPYANDLGPDTVDVSSYPKEHQESFKLLSVRCAKCHTPSRPLNSQFLEPLGKDLKEREAALTAWKKSEPALFSDKNVWQPEADVWQRYVKRMMAKPGCGISKEEGKKIWGFLAYDGNQRKVGANRAMWEIHRKKLLEDFKVKHPARYKELYEKAGVAIEGK